MKDLRTHLYGNPHSTGDPSATCEKRINSVRFKYVDIFKRRISVVIKRKIQLKTLETEASRVSVFA